MVRAAWLRRWVEEVEAASIDEVAMVVGCLVALGGSLRAPAQGSLRALLAGALGRA